MIHLFINSFTYEFNWCNWKVKKKQNFKSTPGSAEIIHEIHLNYEKDESGWIPVIIKPDPEEVKKKRVL